MEMKLSLTYGCDRLMDQLERLISEESSSMNDTSHIPIVFQILSEVFVCFFSDVLFVGDAAMPFSVIGVFECVGSINPLHGKGETHRPHDVNQPLVA